MTKDFEKAYEQFSENPKQVEKELKNCVGKVYKFSYDGVTYYIEVEYFKNFEKIGISHHNDRGESYFDEWDVEHFYEIIKDSVEIDSKE